MSNRDKLQEKRDASLETFLDIAKTAYQRKLVQKSADHGGVTYTIKIPHEQQESANFELYCVASSHDV